MLFISVSINTQILINRHYPQTRILDLLKLSKRYMALTTNKEPFRFMDFPGEIRNECYKHLLCASKSRIEIWYQEIGRDYQSVQKDGTPGNINQTCLSLLLVNKAIQAEASHILYCNKLFVINIHIGYTSSDPMVGRERDKLFKRQNKRSNSRDKGLITLACFRQLANIEIKLIYLARPITDNANTFRPHILRKILYALGGDGKDGRIERDGPEGKSLKITHHPGEIGNKLWNGRQSFLQRELTRDVDGLLTSVRRWRQVDNPDVPKLTYWK